MPSVPITASSFLTNIQNLTGLLQKSKTSHGAEKRKMCVALCMLEGFKAVMDTDRAFDDWYDTKGESCGYLMEQMGSTLYTEKLPVVPTMGTYHGFTALYLGSNLSLDDFTDIRNWLHFDQKNRALPPGKSKQAARMLWEQSSGSINANYNKLSHAYEYSSVGSTEFEEAEKLLIEGLGDSIMSPEIYLASESTGHLIRFYHDWVDISSQDTDSMYFDLKLPSSSAIQYGKTKGDILIPFTSDKGVDLFSTWLTT